MFIKNIQQKKELMLKTQKISGKTVAIILVAVGVGAGMIVLKTIKTIQSQKKQIKALKEELKEKNDIINDLQAQLGGLNNKIMELESIIENLNTEKDQLSNDNKRLAKINVQHQLTAQKDQGNIRQLEARNNDLTNQIQGYQNQLNEYQSKKEILVSQLNLLHNKLIELHLPYTQLAQQNQERVIRIETTVNNIYDDSWRKRHCEIQYKYFVRAEENESELFKNYSIRSADSKNNLRNICTAFRQARGDGNCFYTAFGYQFLLILLIQYNDFQFFSFLNKMKTINLRMQIQSSTKNYIDDENLERLLLDEFIYRLQIIREIHDLEERKNLFTSQFAAYEKFSENTDGCFYGLSTIFFRNLANLAVETSELREAMYDRHTLLLWETECNNNEIVIQALAKYLKIFIKLVFFDNGSFSVKEYGSEYQKYNIILLIRPGHYNIGIKQNQIQQQENEEEQIEEGIEQRIFKISKQTLSIIDETKRIIHAFQ